MLGRVMLAGVAVPAASTEELARIVRTIGGDAIADRLERALADEVRLLALTIDKRAIILAALDDPPDGLAELRAVGMCPCLRGERLEGVLPARPQRYAHLMTSSARMAIALLTAAVSLVPMACGGDEAAMRATLTNDGCTYDGNTSPTGGMFTIEVENQTELSGSFVLLSLAEGSTVDDLQPSLDRYPRQLEREVTPLPEPPDYKVFVRSDVDAGATSALPADVPGGTYAVVCFVDDDLPTEHIYIAEQLDVPGALDR